MFLRLLLFPGALRYCPNRKSQYGRGVLLVGDVGTSRHTDVIEVFQILFFGDVVFTAFHNRVIKTGR